MTDPLCHFVRQHSRLFVLSSTIRDCLPDRGVEMMLNWNEYRKQLALGVKEIGQLSPDTVKGYVELSSAGQKEDLLGAKIRELIALAVAVTSRCDGCITVHTEAAIRHGATKEEIAEALVRDAGELICTSDRVRADQKTFRTADLGQRGGGV